MARYLASAAMLWVLIVLSSPISGVAQQATQRWQLLSTQLGAMQVALDTQTVVRDPGGNVTEVWLRVGKQDEPHTLVRRGIWCEERKWNIWRLVDVDSAGGTQDVDIPAKDVGYSPLIPGSADERILIEVCRIAEAVLRRTGR